MPCTRHPGSRRVLNGHDAQGNQKFRCAACQHDRDQTRKDARNARDRGRRVERYLDSVEDGKRREFRLFMTGKE